LDFDKKVGNKQGTSLEVTIFYCVRPSLMRENEHFFRLDSRNCAKMEIFVGTFPGNDGQFRVFPQDAKTTTYRQKGP
jgi:hypothetical protein